MLLHSSMAQGAWTLYMEPKVATFSGEMDFTGRYALRASLSELSDVDVAIVDLSSVTYIDSSSLAELVLLSKARSRASRTPFRLIASPAVLHVFKLAGCTSLVAMYPSLDKALRG